MGIILRFRGFMTQRMGTQASTIIYYVMILIALLFATFGILETIGVRSTDLLTGAGIISITAGLVISTFVGSILSGFLVFTNYKFKVGDNVMVNNIPGKVIEMTRSCHENSNRCRSNHHSKQRHRIWGSNHNSGP